MFGDLMEIIVIGERIKVGKVTYIIVSHVKDNLFLAVKKNDELPARVYLIERPTTTPSE